MDAPVTRADARPGSAGSGIDRTAANLAPSAVGTAPLAIVIVLQDSCARPDRERRGSRPRSWIAWMTPTASSAVIVPEPPKLMKGSGMPVIGAMPIVIPTLMKTENRSQPAMPAATTLP